MTTMSLIEKARMARVEIRFGEETNGVFLSPTPEVPYYATGEPVVYFHEVEAVVDHWGDDPIYLRFWGKDHWYTVSSMLRLRAVLRALADRPRSLPEILKAPMSPMERASRWLC